MPKWDAVGFGAKNADVDPESIGSIYDEASVGIPPRGVYRFLLKRLQATETGEKSNKPGTPMMRMVCEIAEPKGTKKAKYNGYGIWFYRTVEEENANRVNQFLMALMGGTKLTAAKKKAVLRAFWDGNVVVDDKDMITKIGTWTIPTDGIEVAANTQNDKYQGNPSLGIQSLIPISDAPAPVAADEEDAEDSDEEFEDEDEADEESDEFEDEDEGDDESEEEDDPAAAREEELAGYDRKNLVAAAKVHKLKTVKVSDDDLIAAILDIEFPEAEEEPEDDEEEPEDEEAEEEEDEEEDEEDDEEEEPEPPAKPARRTRAANPAPSARKAPSGRAKSTAAPSSRPAARRRKGSAEPPF